jgi:hypothetical protein
MMNLELSRLDQTTILFFIFSAIGLIRERRVLPFVMVLLGTLLHGPLAAILFSGLVIWHRIDSKATAWIQLKDFIGFFLIMMGAISPEPFREFSGLLGVILISMSFGGGMLGTIPALVLFRQYFPQPEQLEIPLIGAGVYWFSAELLRWSKSKHEQKILPFLEAICTLVILFGFHVDVQKWAEESSLVILASTFVFIVAALFAWVKWRNEGFLKTYRAFRVNMLKALTVGGRMISDRDVWEGREPATSSVSLESGFDRIFYVVLGTMICVGIFILIGRGGFLS